MRIFTTSPSYCLRRLGRDLQSISSIQSLLAISNFSGLWGFSLSDTFGQKHSKGKPPESTESSENGLASARLHLSCYARKALCWRIPLLGLRVEEQAMTYSQQETSVRPSLDLLQSGGARYGLTPTDLALLGDTRDAAIPIITYPLFEQGL